MGAAEGRIVRKAAGPPRSPGVKCLPPRFQKNFPVTPPVFLAATRGSGGGPTLFSGRDCRSNDTILRRIHRPGDPVRKKRLRSSPQDIAAVLALSRDLPTAPSPAISGQMQAGEGGIS